MLYLAIDENGYGPVMGPLVVTGITGTSDITEGWPNEIFDSKRLFNSSNGYEKIEKISLCLFKITKKRLPENTLEIFENFQQNVDCPQKHSSICFKNLPEIPFWTSKDKIFEYCEYFSEFLDKRGTKILFLKSVTLCVGGFNRLCKNDLKKDFINYLLFEKIITHSAEKCESLFVLAGKIGGRKSYHKFLQNGFSQWKISEIIEDRNTSTYLMKKNNNEIHLNFVNNIESKSFLGVLAGIYGKYVRELLMIGINRSMDTEEYISGYRDTRTKKFLEKFNNIEFNTDCLLRIK
ncbi:MAG: hypothetical protein N2115_00455 [bacterium]|nr:hypothetical protein [bacterium]